MSFIMRYNFCVSLCEMFHCTEFEYLRKMLKFNIKGPDWDRRIFVQKGDKKYEKKIL